MRKAALLFALVGLMAAPALAGHEAPWSPVARAPDGFNNPPGRDWDHPIKWDQLDPWDLGWGAWSTIDDVYGNYNLCADDWMCDGSPESRYITDIHLHGWCDFGTADIAAFEVKFYADVPAEPGVDESHPGTMLQECIVYPEAGGVGWSEVEENLFAINLPQDCWFDQGLEDGTIYWLSIRGITMAGGWFAWAFVDYPVSNIDDAVLQVDGVGPYSHWGWVEDPTYLYAPETYEGVYPGDPFVGSADMSFYLTAIPEPGSLTLLGIGGLALVLRRR